VSTADFEDDKYSGIALSSPLMKGMDLDLSFAAASKNTYKRGDCEGIQEESVTVVFDLPDGSQGESSFKLGQTVEVLKSYIESEYGIPMADQKLYLEDRQMHNPFSLLDYPEAKGSVLICELTNFGLTLIFAGADEMFVRVEGYLPKNSKK
jgi:hypothetical protein